LTTKTATQAGAELLYRQLVGGDVTQAGVEVLHRVGTEVEVSQVGVEYLHRVLPLHTVTQVGVEYLHKAVPCTTRWAQIWTIERTDGEIIRLTSLDRDLIIDGEIYDACDSLAPSASEGAASAGSIGNMDLSGAVSANVISEQDLAAGLYDGATVKAVLREWDGPTIRKVLLDGTFGAVQHSETGFTVEVIGDGAKLVQTPLVAMLKPDCRWKFGDGNCTKALGPLTVTGTVDSGEGQRGFTDAARVETAGYFSRGQVTFTSGLNDGISAEIKEHATGGVFTLWPRLAYPVVVGDQYSMTPGCTNMEAASGGTNGCTAWANFVNFGGFKWVPGADAAKAAADVKTG
jgi:uncharacterized phage protein (TIGR02218 family)